MTTSDATLDPMANGLDARLWVERIGHRRYTGYNDRGARVEIGNTGDEGVFGPVELIVRDVEKPNAPARTASAAMRRICAISSSVAFS